MWLQSDGSWGWGPLEAQLGHGDTLSLSNSSASNVAYVVPSALKANFLPDGSGLPIGK